MVTHLNKQNGTMWAWWAVKVNVENGIALYRIVQVNTEGQEVVLWGNTPARWYEDVLRVMEQTRQV